jgi:hypothetical protein
MVMRHRDLRDAGDNEASTTGEAASHSSIRLGHREAAHSPVQFGSLASRTSGERWLRSALRRAAVGGVGARAARVVTRGAPGGEGVGKPAARRQR